MALVIKRTSSWWYALFKSNGRRRAINLKVRIEGTRPASIGDTGDDAFERSRGKAIEAHDQLLRSSRRTGPGERPLQKLAELKTGREVTFPKLADLADHWAASRVGRPRTNSTPSSAGSA
jgi:hypothetical protein